MTATHASIWHRQVLPGRIWPLAVGMLLGGGAVTAGFALAGAFDALESAPVVLDEVASAEVTRPQVTDPEAAVVDEGVDVDALVATIPTVAKTDLELLPVLDAVNVVVAQGTVGWNRLGILVSWGPYVTEDPSGAGVATYREGGVPSWTLVTAAGSEEFGQDAEAAAARVAEYEAQWGDDGRVVELSVTG